MYRGRNGFSTYIENAVSGELIRERIMRVYILQIIFRGTFKICANISIYLIETRETNHLSQISQTSVECSFKLKRIKNRIK